MSIFVGIFYYALGATITAFILGLTGSGDSGGNGILALFWPITLILFVCFIGPILLVTWLGDLLCKIVVYGSKLRGG
jgi:hypothetical protein